MLPNPIVSEKIAVEKNNLKDSFAKLNRKVIALRDRVDQHIEKARTHFNQIDIIVSKSSRLLAELTALDIKMNTEQQQKLKLALEENEKFKKKILYIQNKLLGKLEKLFADCSLFSQINLILGANEPEAHLVKSLPNYIQRLARAKEKFLALSTRLSINKFILFKETVESNYDTIKLIYKKTKANTKLPKLNTSFAAVSETSKPNPAACDINNIAIAQPLPANNHEFNKEKEEEEETENLLQQIDKLLGPPLQKPVLIPLPLGNNIKQNKDKQGTTMQVAKPKPAFIPRPPQKPKPILHAANKENIAVPRVNITPEPPTRKNIVTTRVNITPEPPAKENVVPRVNITPGPPTQPKPANGFSFKRSRIRICQ